MGALSLRLELMNPTDAKKHMYQHMTELNTAFSNWLLHYDGLARATSKTTRNFPEKNCLLLSSIRPSGGVKSKKKNQKARTFRRFWCVFNNQNIRVEKENGLYKLSFPTLEKRIGVPVVAEVYQQHWLYKILDGQAKHGTGELYEKKDKWYMSLSVSFEPNKTDKTSSRIMGIDIGLNYLAVAAIGTTSLFFRGNEAAFVRRRFAARRRRLGKEKLLYAIKKSKHKES